MAAEPSENRGKTGNAGYWDVSLAGLMQRPGQTLVGSKGY